MRQLINTVAPRATTCDMAAIRVGVWRVMLALEESGQVEISRPNTGNGSFASYRWKTITSSPRNPLHKPSQYVRATAP
jgi:hypothetical protein